MLMEGLTEFEYELIDAMNAHVLVASDNPSHRLGQNITLTFRVHDRKNPWMIRFVVGGTSRRRKHQDWVGSDTTDLLVAAADALGIDGTGRRSAYTERRFAAMLGRRPVPARSGDAPGHPIA